MTERLFNFVLYLEELGASLDRHFLSRQKTPYNVRRYLYKDLIYEYSKFGQEERELLVVIDPSGDVEEGEEDVVYCGLPPQNKEFADQLIFHITSVLLN